MASTHCSQASRGDTLFYDASCPLCSKEIATLKNLDSGGLSFVDANLVEEDGDYLPSKDDMLRRLHLRTQDKQWLVGLEANIYAWRNTPYAFLWKVLKLPIIFQLASFIYEAWAKIRYRKAVRGSR